MAHAQLPLGPLTWTEVVGGNAVLMVFIDLGTAPVTKVFLPATNGSNPIFVTPPAPRAAGILNAAGFILPPDFTGIEPEFLGPVTAPIGTEGEMYIGLAFLERANQPLSEALGVMVPYRVRIGESTLFLQGPDGSLSFTRQLSFGGAAFFAPSDAEGPMTSAVLATPNPVAVGTDIILTANVDDSTTGGSNILEAKYAINGDTPFPMGAQDGTFDAVSENVSEVIPAFTEPGVREICVDGTDVWGNIGAKERIFLVVFDPSSGFVTGGGWINSPEGAYTPNPALIGKANFGFVSKYKKGAKVPTGITEFQFRVADLNFHSDNYQWLVISGPKAQFKGVGTINGVGNHGFLLTAVDGQMGGGGGTDKFRIKIWDEDSGMVIYDNKLGSDDYGNDATELGGGNIVIQK
ncbi:MAG: hypothetical protein ACM3TN_19035 [Alphaproteobacteria bacterium]